MVEASFRVRVHDLSSTARNEYIEERMGAPLGRVEDVDLEHGEAKWEKFIRTRVNPDITNPGALQTS